MKAIFKRLSQLERTLALLNAARPRLSLKGSYDVWQKNVASRIRVSRSTTPGVTRSLT
jgi:hypothetical protein